MSPRMNSSSSHSRRLRRNTTQSRITSGYSVHAGGIRALSNANQVYRFQQYLPDQLVNQQATNPTFAAYLFAINALDQATTLEALFDQYRITKIEMCFRPMYKAIGLSVPVNTIVPQIHVAPDFDDATAWTTLAQAREYSTLSVHELDDFTVCIKPHLALAAYGGAFSSYANTVDQWVDAGSPNVQYYGIKIAIDAGAVGATLFQQWNITTRMHIEFRNVR